MTTTFRLVRPEDSDELLSIYAPYITDTTISFEMTVPSREEYAKRIEGIASMYPYILACHDGAILGYAYASAFHERPGYRYSVSVSVYVRPDCKGRGIGKALYRRLFALLTLQGVRVAYAIITQANAASVGLHRFFGFSDVGLLHRCGYKHGEWLDVLYMEKNLGEFDTEPGPILPIGDVPIETITAILDGAVD